MARSHSGKGGHGYQEVADDKRELLKLIELREGQIVIAKGVQLMGRRRRGVAEVECTLWNAEAGRLVEIREKNKSAKTENWTTASK